MSFGLRWHGSLYDIYIIQEDIWRWPFDNGAIPFFNWLQIKIKARLRRIFHNEYVNNWMWWYSIGKNELLNSLSCWPIPFKYVLCNLSMFYVIEDSTTRDSSMSRVTFKLRFATDSWQISMVIYRISIIAWAESVLFIVLYYILY